MPKTSRISTSGSIFEKGKPIGSSDQSLQSLTSSDCGPVPNLAAAGSGALVDGSLPAASGLNDASASVLLLPSVAVLVPGTL